MPVSDHFTDQDKQWTYEVWAMLAGRNAAKTSRILAEPPGENEESDRPPMEVPARTIRYWVQAYHWEDRIEREFKRLFPGIHQHVHQEIMVGTIESVDYARKVVRGEVEADKVRLDAAKTFLDRGGHLPYVRPSNDSKPLGPTRDYAESAAGLTPDELMQKLFGPDSPELAESIEDDEETQG